MLIKSNLSLSPFLPFWRRRSVFTFIIFFGYIWPVGWKNCATAAGEAFHHGSSLIFICILEDLLEEEHARVNCILLGVLQNITFNFRLYFVPIFLCFRTRGVANLLCFLCLSQASSVFSQREPWNILLLFLHHDFDALKSVNFFCSSCDDIPVQVELQMVDSAWL